MGSAWILKGEGAGHNPGDPVFMMGAVKRTGHPATICEQLTLNAYEIWQF